MQSSIAPLTKPVAAAVSTEGVRPRQKSQHPRGTSLFLPLNWIKHGMFFVSQMVCNDQRVIPDKFKVNGIFTFFISQKLPIRKYLPATLSVIRFIGSAFHI